MADMIRIDNLNSHFDGQDILHDISISIQGGFTAIAGPNGAGKSTLLKYLIREMKAMDEEVFIFGDDINSLKQKEIAKRISFEGQYGSRNDDFTVGEMVAFGRYAYGDQYSCDTLVEESLRKTSILHLKNKSITKISGGEFQLAMLARTICQDTKILALDEPVNNLDPKHQQMLLGLLSDLANEGKTVICVLHDLNAVLNHCDKCILMKEGTIYACGETKDVLNVENIKAVYEIDAEICELQPTGRKMIVF